MVVTLSLWPGKGVFAQCNYTSLLTAPNMVTNGNFSNGNTGFTSDYLYSTTNPLPGSTYIITTNAATVHFAYTGVDHTSGTGNFMVLNGATAPSKVWKQTIPVVQNTYYDLSAWFKNIVTKPGYIGLPIASVELWINNTKISSTLDLPDYPDVWKLLDTFWYSGSSTSAFFEIKNLGTSGNGNDFAIDDISFKKCCSGQPRVYLQVCKGDSIQLNGNPSGIFTWFPGGGLSSPSIGNPKASPAGTINYILHSNIGSGSCEVYDTFTVTVIPNGINLGPDKLICEGDSFVFNNTAPGNYDWSPIYAIDNNKIPNPTVRPTIPTYYYVTVTNGSCVARDTIHFDIVNVKADAGSDKTICVGDSVQLSGIAIGIFTWTPVINISSPSDLNPWVKPINTVKYVLTSTAGTCTKTDTAIVTVIKTSSADAGTDVSGCKGAALQLNASGGANHMWLTHYFISDSVITNPIVKPLTDTFYVYRAGYGNSCFGYDTVNVFLVNPPQVKAGNDFSYCYNSSAKMIAEVKFFDTLWWTPAAGLSSTSEVQPFTFGNNNRQYILWAGFKGCITCDTVKVKVHPPIIAKIVPTPLLAYAPGDILFINKSTNAYYFLWDFGDGNTSDKAGDQTHTYADTGTYRVRLLVNDSIGCFDSTIVYVQLVKNPYLYIPNAITPNGDGLNDNFAIVYNPDAFTYLTYRIYDRWGELIFETQMPGGQWWDGTFKNKPCQSDSYFYVLEAEDLAKKSYSHKGNVNLLR